MTPELALHAGSGLALLASPLMWQHVYETSSPSYRVIHKGEIVATGRTAHRQGAVIVELEGGGHTVTLKRKKNAAKMTVQLDDTKKFCTLDRRPSNREPIDVVQCGWRIRAAPSLLHRIRLRALHRQKDIQIYHSRRFCLEPEQRHVAFRWP